MKPHIELKLDTAAMEALFPEGSEARVKLQQAVVQNFIDRQIRMKVDDQLALMIQTVVQQITADMKSAMNHRFTWEGLGQRTAKLTTDYRTELKRELHALIDEEVSIILLNSRQECVNTIDEKMKSFDTLLPGLTESTAVARIQDHVRRELVQKLQKGD